MNGLEVIHVNTIEYSDTNKNIFSIDIEKFSTIITYFKISIQVL